jgi:hypothetical protein
MNDIVKFCNKKNCEKSVMYNKLSTGGNDPNISSRMKCAHQIKTYSRSRSSLDSKSKACAEYNYNIQNGISNCPPSVLALIENNIKKNGGSHSISTIQNNVLSKKYSPFPCTNPIFSGQNIYSSRNVSQCKCSSI